MSSPSKVNGDITDDSVAKSPPCPQRKPRLNRRGFHLSNHPLMNLLSDKSEKKLDVNGHNDSTENKTDSSQKKIISLNSVKNSTSDKDSTVKSKQSSTIINLKKSSFSPNGNSGATEISTSGDPPPKKKHKPITWP